VYAVDDAAVSQQVLVAKATHDAPVDARPEHRVSVLAKLDAAKRQCPSVASQHWLDAANCYICRKFREFVACLQNAPKNPSLLCKTLGPVALLFWSRNIL